MRFILVDRIVSLVPGKSIVAERFIAPDDDYFADHFPGFPVVPGVLLTEMMAQAAGKCLDAERHARGKAMLAKILSASFRQWVRPGAEAQLQAQITANEERYASADCSVQVEGITVAQGKLFFSFLPAGTFAANLEDKVLDDFLAQQPQ